GTGHGSFVKDDDGNFWMYYHANPSLTVPEGSTWWAERSTYVKPFSFTTKTINGKSVSYPSFGTPVAPNSTQTISVDTADYHEEDAHHYSPVFTISSGEVTELYRTCYICGETKVESVTFAKAPAFSLEADTNSVLIKWNKIEGADGYRVYRRDEGDNTEYLRLADVGDNNSYTDKNLESGVRYRYLIHAYYFDLNGEYKYTATGGKGIYTALVAPNVSAVQTSAKTITVTIQAVDNATEYVLYRSVNGSSFEEYAKVSALEYVDTDVVAESDYEYKVIAKSANSASAYSVTVKVSTIIMAANLDKVTSGDLFDAISARAPESEVNVFTSAEKLDKTVVISRELFAECVFYSVHSDYIVPAVNYEKLDEDNYAITFRHANADAIIFAKEEIITYGDATSDGEITLLDAIRTLRYVASHTSSLDIAATDTNYDLSTDIEDILAILSASLN
ncbi:MAG: hypothetical protein IJC81_00040, partial [Clostridia bacterium]|nr:hypothetical protein [Clostridia bacterium]